ncbi:laccase [Serpula lacrymans var. lacrymans S7.3]|uniref:Laccase n=2 Tax=Serpula lacrymans var. lacrymans TaxID=341189 RepID=F8Q476_SERL3|nr:multicopper oxidase [Serpula lacrymans var. lacrymans S7.9]EGN96932.1 laccase [Serpula lacrymans var. lacrymans S7.3]EGO22525.1 multicopper oxidase [Serpula lacrymans var. lacrymans S7.9]
MFHLARLCSFVLASISACHAAIGPVADLRIVNGEISPDGFPRVATLAGGSFPGPVIRGNKGDNFQINVINELVNHTDTVRSTTVHWHGIHQHGQNIMDGLAFVTQCPIAPGNSFLYNFTIPDQAGTFWYHSHYQVQYCDGLKGALIVDDPEDPYRFWYDVDDESTIITLSDWYHEPAELVPRPAVIDSALINGVGRYDGGPQVPLAVVNVEPWKRYRIRLINMACKPAYTFSIDKHVFTVIEADGVNTDPYIVDSLQIFAAQRYSFILEANQPVDNYWIRALPSRGDPSFEDGHNSAVLRYRGAPEEEPTNKTWNLNLPLNESYLHSLEPHVPGSPGLGGADIELNLNFTKPDNEYVDNYTVNGHSYIPPSVPVLLQIMSGARTAQQLLPMGNVYPLPRNKVIELTLPGGAPGGPHPFHLHGHDFSVVRSAGSTAHNYYNPVRRDTVSIGEGGDNVTIRFTTDNPGPWMLHCHIDWHLYIGMALVFVEAPDDIVSTDLNATNPNLESWTDLCPVYNSLPQDEV